MALGPFGPPDPFASDLQAPPGYEDFGPYVPEDASLLQGPYGDFTPEPQQPSEPLEQYRDVDPPDPSPEFVKRAFDYVSEFCRASANYMRPIIDDTERWWKWYNGKLNIHDLEDARPKDKRVSTSQSRSEPELNVSSEADTSDFLYPIDPLVNAVVFYAFLVIFTGAEFLTLTNEDDSGISSAQDLTRLNEVIKRLLLKRIRQGRFKSNQRITLIDWVLTGTAVTTTFYYKHKIRKWRENLLTGEIEEYEDVVYECPITQGIKLASFLPDAKATSTDVNRWRGVGHIIRKTYDEAIQDFASGYYHLNKDEFEKLFKDRGDEGDATSGRSTTEYNEDAGTDTEEEGVSTITFVEWQGKVPDPKRGLVECVAVIAYEKDHDTKSDDFKTGLIVRLSQQTISSSGLRTINVSQWSPLPGPCGKGLPASALEFLYQASQLIGQMQDAASRACSGAYGGLDHDTALKESMGDNGTVPPSGIVWMTDKNSLFPLPPPATFAFAEIQSIAQQLLSIVERSVGAEEPNQDVAENMKATNFRGLQERSQAPGTARTQAYAEEIVAPAANLCLSFLVDMTFTDQTVLAPDFDTGTDMPVVITPEDLRRGKWIVDVALNNMDSSQIATTQIFIGLIQQAPLIKQLLQEDGKDLSVAEILNIIMTNLKVPMSSADRVVRTIGPREQMLIEQNQQLQQQIAEMEAAMGQGPGPQGGNGKEPPNPASGNAPPEFGMNGGPMGPEPTDDNITMLQQQLEMASRMGQVPQ